MISCICCWFLFLSIYSACKRLCFFSGVMFSHGNNRYAKVEDTTNNLLLEYMHVNQNFGQNQ